MADEDVQKLLVNLKLEGLIENFKKNMITMDVLKNLSESLISELIPIIGERVVFLSYWKKHYCTNLCTENSPSNKKRKIEEDVINLNEDKENCISQENNSIAKVSSILECKRSIMPLKDLLLKYKIGQRILTYYETENRLEENFRHKLCDIIISDIESKNIKFTNDLADTITKMIVSVFPTEVESTYYVAPISKKDSITKKAVIARGKLINKWRNRCTLNKKFEAKLKKEESIEERKEDVLGEIDIKVQESIKWLDENLAPWELVLQHWTVTFDIRRETLNNSEEKTLYNFFNKWSSLKHPQGYQLIVQDFNQMNLSKVNLSFDIWKQFMNTTIKYSTYNTKNDEINIMLEKLQDEDISTDTKVATGLMFLSHLIPPKQLKKYGSKCYKPSIAHSKSSMIKYASIPGDMTLIKQEARNNAELLKITLQPYIIILGSSDKVKETYVQVDDILYKTNSTLEAIDVCFKTFHVFQVNYPLMSEHIWMLIQKGIYNFNTKWDTTIPNIEYMVKRVRESLAKTINSESII